MKKLIDLVDQVFNDGSKLGVVHLSTEDETLNGRTIKMQNQDMVNFGSCSYLGLEVDERLKQASIEAVEKYGTLFASSRSYVSLGLYEEIEDLLFQIFGKPSLLAPTTSLGHISIIPTLIGENDAIILDFQVHASVQNAVQLMKAQGIHIKTIPHNNMDALEKRIKTLSEKYDKVWYMADGIYSMYGDVSPLKDVEYLLNKYEKFHFYVDDAHGMSWLGKNGAGYVLKEMDFHPRMIFTTTLGKSFASSGGALVFPDKEQAQKVRNCGAGLMFSGPVSPAILGTAIASAKIHLSPEIYELQDKLHRRIEHFSNHASMNDLLVINEHFTPIFFIGVGKLEVGFNLCKRMMKAGYYMNIGLYPAVPYKNTGMRVTLNGNLAMEDIENMLSIMAEELPKALADEGSSLDEVYEAFKVEPKQRKANAPKKLKVNKNESLSA